VTVIAYGNVYIAWPLALALLAAGLVQLAFYFSLASPKWREFWTPPRLIVLAPIPWMLYSIPCGVFRPHALVALLGLVALAAFWFHFLPASRYTDLGFVALMAAPILFNWFGAIYPRPWPKVPTETLGHVVWIQVGVATILNVRRIDSGFGFWPQLRHWRAGALWFLASMPPVLALVYGLGFAHFELPATGFKYAVALPTFFGILWVVALSEEFFFRGLLQRWIEEWSGRPALAIGVASTLFGLAHLGYRQFPNWEMALLAAVMGVFYGLAYRQGGGVRAAMVAHALVVTTWKTFFH
jgi:membrane protease YdiL (CAAX protease family)